MRNTAFRFLQRLGKEGLVKQVTFEGGARAWVRITRESDKDSLLRLVDEWATEHPDSNLPAKEHEILRITGTKYEST